ncbi:MAG: polyisoprenoid-binding protein [Roseibium sp.]|uniref:YceI family protein n=1 Tax=Roseibium sp. TaxID=1936156 RepID=UPI001B1F272C|nr:YceI family protein [Roseibium sp.]MBO6891329.1 polyisoprenoid-binding protein [Roseibium sp.]MBO6931780.1 polyisoprenoid-binding protein [Roseibium sp.]
MKRFAATALAFSLMAGAAVAQPVAYEFDKSHANLSFTYNHLGYSTTDGRFGNWEGSLLIDKEAPSNSSVEFTIDIDSLDTFWADRDTHLKSADFFDAAKFPQATFKSTKVEQTGEQQLEVTGDLTIKGITKPATLTVNVTAMGEHPMAKKEAAGFAVTTVVKRSDYGMDLYVPYVGDEVTVTFHAETLKTDATN